MNVQKESLKKDFGFHASSRKPTRKCTMKIKIEEKKNSVLKIWEGVCKVHMCRKVNHVMSFNELQVNDSMKVCTIFLVNK